MPSFEFIGAYPRFYPDVRDADGKSLMALLGMVADFDPLPPSDGQWIPTDKAPDWPAEAVPEAPAEPPAPEPIFFPQEPPAPSEAPPVAPVPVPELVPVPEPVPAPEPTAPPEFFPPLPEPAPAPEPAPVPEPVAVPEAAAEAAPVAPQPFNFPGFASPGQPYSR